LGSVGPQRPAETGVGPTGTSPPAVFTRENIQWGVGIWLKADDPQHLHDEIVRAGVPILVEPFDGPFGRTFTFADPDAYAMTIHG